MNATAQKKIVPNRVLVTGASGLLGGCRDREVSFRGLGGGRRLTPQARAAQGPGR
jgi:hypothetical protein